MICSTDTVAGYVLAVEKVQELIVYSRFGLFLETPYSNVAEILHMPSFKLKHYLTSILGLSSHETAPVVGGRRPQILGVQEF